MYFTSKLLKSVSLTLVLVFVAQASTFASGQASDLNGSELGLRQLQRSLSIPKSTASVADVYLDPTKPMVYLIEDPHANPSGQLNLAKALQYLLGKKNVRYVFTEGGFGDVSLTRYRLYGEPAERKRISREYLQKALLHGEEYLDINSDYPFMIWGVEDPVLYAQALELYRQVARDRAQFDIYLNKIKSAQNLVGRKQLNPVLWQLQADKQRYNDEKLTFTQYAELLLKRHQMLGLETLYPSLRKLERFEGFETSLKKIRNPRHKAALVNKYIQKEMDYDLLLNELKALEAELFESLAETQEEKWWVRAALTLNSYQKLLSLQITPDEYSAYQKHALSLRALTGFLNRQILNLSDYYESAVFFESDFERALFRAQQFYELTLARDKAFIRNLKAKSAREPSALIAGGYHTPHLKRLLKEEGYSYTVITPAVTQKTNFSRYEKVLLGQPSWLPKNQGVGLNFQAMRAGPEAGRGIVGERLARLGIGYRRELNLNDVKRPERVRSGARLALWGYSQALRELIRVALEIRKSVQKDLLFNGVQDQLSQTVQAYRKRNGISGDLVLDREMQRTLAREVAPLVLNWQQKNREKLLRSLSDLKEGFDDQGQHHQSILVKNEDFSIVAHMWKPDGETRIHNYGGAMRFAIALEQGLVEDEFESRAPTVEDLPAAGQQVRLIAARSHFVPTNQLSIAFNGRGSIRRIRNEANEPKIMLEFVFPPLKDKVATFVPVEGRPGEYLVRLEQPENTSTNLNDYLKKDADEEDVEKMLTALVRVGKSPNVYTEKNTVLVSEHDLTRYLQVGSYKVIKNRVTGDYVLVRPEEALKGARLALAEFKSIEEMRKNIQTMDSAWPAEFQVIRRDLNNPVWEMNVIKHIIFLLNLSRTFQLLDLSPEVVEHVKGLCIKKDLTHDERGELARLYVYMLFQLPAMKHREPRFIETTKKQFGFYALQNPDGTANTSLSQSGTVKYRSDEKPAPGTEVAYSESSLQKWARLLMAKRLGFMASFGMTYARARPIKDFRFPILNHNIYFRRGPSQNPFVISEILLIDRETGRAEKERWDQHLKNDFFPHISFPSIRQRHGRLQDLGMVNPLDFENERRNAAMLKLAEDAEISQSRERSGKRVSVSQIAETYFFRQVGEVFLAALPESYWSEAERLIEKHLSPGIIRYEWNCCRYFFSQAFSARDKKRLATIKVFSIYFAMAIFPENVYKLQGETLPAEIEEFIADSCNFMSERYFAHDEVLVKPETRVFNGETSKKLAAGDVLRLRGPQALRSDAEYLISAVAKHLPSSASSAPTTRLHLTGYSILQSDNPFAQDTRTTEKLAEDYRYYQAAFKEKVARLNADLVAGQRVSFYEPGGDFSAGLWEGLKRLRRLGYRVELEVDQAPLEAWLATVASENAQRRAKAAFMLGDVSQVQSEMDVAYTKKKEALGYPIPGKPVENNDVAHVFYGDFENEGVEPVSGKEDGVGTEMLLADKSHIPFYKSPFRRFYENDEPVNQKNRAYLDQIVDSFLGDLVVGLPQERAAKLHEVRRALSTLTDREMDRLIKSFARVPYAGMNEFAPLEVFTRIEALFPNVFAQMAPVIGPAMTLDGTTPYQMPKPIPSRCDTYIATVDELKKSIFEKTSLSEARSDAAVREIIQKKSPDLAEMVSKIRKLLEQDGKFEFVGEAANYVDGVCRSRDRDKLKALAAALYPMLDRKASTAKESKNILIRTPGMNASDADRLLAEIRKRLPALPDDLLVDAERPLVVVHVESLQRSLFREFKARNLIAKAAQSEKIKGLLKNDRSALVELSRTQKIANSVQTGSVPDDALSSHFEKALFKGLADLRALGYRIHLSVETLKENEWYERDRGFYHRDVDAREGFMTGNVVQWKALMSLYEENVANSNKHRATLSTKAIQEAVDDKEGGAALRVVIRSVDRPVVDIKSQLPTEMIDSLPEGQSVESYQAEIGKLGKEESTGSLSMSAKQPYWVRDFLLSLLSIAIPADQDINHDGYLALRNAVASLDSNDVVKISEDFKANPPLARAQLENNTLVSKALFDELARRFPEQFPADAPFVRAMSQYYSQALKVGEEPAQPKSLSGQNDRVQESVDVAGEPVDKPVDQNTDVFDLPVYGDSERWRDLQVEIDFAAKEIAEKTSSDWRREWIRTNTKAKLSDVKKEEILRRVVDPALDTAAENYKSAHGYIADIQDPELRRRAFNYTIDKAKQSLLQFSEANEDEYETRLAIACAKIFEAYASSEDAGEVLLQEDVRIILAGVVIYLKYLENDQSGEGRARRLIEAYDELAKVLGGDARFSDLMAPFAEIAEMKDRRAELFAQEVSDGARLAALKFTVRVWDTQKQEGWIALSSPTDYTDSVLIQFKVKIEESGRIFIFKYKDQILKVRNPIHIIYKRKSNGAVGMKNIVIKSGRVVSVLSDFGAEHQRKLSLTAVLGRAVSRKPKLILIKPSQLIPLKSKHRDQWVLWLVESLKNFDSDKYNALLILDKDNQVLRQEIISAAIQRYGGRPRVYLAEEALPSTHINGGIAAIDAFRSPLPLPRPGLHLRFKEPDLNQTHNLSELIFLGVLLADLKPESAQPGHPDFERLCNNFQLVTGNTIDNRDAFAGFLKGEKVLDGARFAIEAVKIDRAMRVLALGARMAAQAA